jgi:tetratricopeptide (TPR) repeat protein
VMLNMTDYFLDLKNFEMAEKTCHLLRNIAPHDLKVMGLLTETLIGQNRWEEAIQIGVPVVELSGILGELPDRFSLGLIVKMSSYLVQKKDYSALVRLWEAGAKCKEDDVDVLAQLIKALNLQGSYKRAKEILKYAMKINPNDAELIRLEQQLDAGPSFQMLSTSAK